MGKEHAFSGFRGRSAEFYVGGGEGRGGEDGTMFHFGWDWDG